MTVTIITIENGWVVKSPDNDGDEIITAFSYDDFAEREEVLEQLSHLLWFVRDSVSNLESNHDKHSNVNINIEVVKEEE